MNSFVLTKSKSRWWNIKYAAPRLKAVREDTRYWRTLTEKDSLAPQIVASMEDDDTYVIRAVIDCRSVNDDAASKFIGVSPLPLGSP